MKTPILAAVVLGVFVSVGPSQTKLQPDPPHRCDACDGWNQPRDPFKVFGNTYFVGTANLGAVLIVSDGGSILLDGGLPQSAPLIDAGIRALGFKTENIRLILNSHAHYDHAGGIAALQRVSGATVVASAPGARAIERGEPTDDDPQYAFGRAANGYPASKSVRAVKEGEVVRVGDLAVTAHLTPGHTPGSTSWSWRSCEGSRCLNLVYADSLNAVSAPGFRFSGGGGQPGIVESFRASIARVASLPCDIRLTVHPESIDLDGKLKRRAAKPAADPFIDPGGCRAHAAGAAKRLDARIAEERRGGGQ